MALFPRVIQTVEGSVQAAALRHRVIAQNVANVNVPGYRALEVRFEEHLREALSPAQPQGLLPGRTAHLRHIPIGARPAPRAVQPVVVETAGARLRQDGNGVDLEEQMARLAANQLWYQALIRSLTDELGRLKAAVDGRR